MCHELRGRDWLSKHNNGWWTSIRYGQVPIPIDDGGQALIGTLEEVAAFFAAVAVSIEREELDAQILKLHGALGRADEEGEPACQSGLADPTTCGLSCRWGPGRSLPGLDMCQTKDRPASVRRSFYGPQKFTAET